MKSLLALLAATAALALAAPAARARSMPRAPRSRPPRPRRAPAATDSPDGGSQTWVVILAAGVAFVAGAAGARLVSLPRAGRARHDRHERRRVDPAVYKETTRLAWERAASAWDGWGGVLERWLAEATEVMLDNAGVTCGSRVLDVAAGAGGQALAAAERTGPDGIRARHRHRRGAGARSTPRSAGSG